MEYAHSLQNIIQKISQKFQFDLNRTGARYQLELSDGKALIIEVVNPLQINIYDQFAQSNKVKIEIFTGWNSWVPLSVSLSDAPSRVSAVIDREAQSIDIVDPEGYMFLNRGCRHSAMSFRFDFLKDEKEQPKATACFNDPALLQVA